MITENDVVDALASHLESVGCVIESTCTTAQTGVDLVARHQGTGRRLRVEAKGGTSSKAHTERFGKAFNANQVQSRVARALYAAAALLCRHPDDDVAMALPHQPWHRQRIQTIGPVLDGLGISVYFVAEDRSVRRRPVAPK